MRPCDDIVIALPPQFPDNSGTHHSFVPRHINLSFFFHSFLPSLYYCIILNYSSLFSIILNYFHYFALFSVILNYSSLFLVLLASQLFQRRLFQIMFHHDPNQFLKSRSGRIPPKLFPRLCRISPEIYHVCRPVEIR